jgi:hypothetical protein
MLESLSLQLNTLKDYKDICRAVLSPGMFLTWKAMSMMRLNNRLSITNKQMCHLWQKCYKGRGNMPHPLYKPKESPNILTSEALFSMGMGSRSIARESSTV